MKPRIHSTVAILAAMISGTVLCTAIADRSPSSEKKAKADSERVNQTTQHFDNPGRNAPTAGHPDTHVQTAPVIAPKTSTGTVSAQQISKQENAKEQAHQKAVSQQHPLDKGNVPAPVVTQPKKKTTGSVPTGN